MSNQLSPEQQDALIEKLKRAKDRKIDAVDGLNTELADIRAIGWCLRRVFELATLSQQEIAEELEDAECCNRLFFLLDTKAHNAENWVNQIHPAPAT